MSKSYTEFGTIEGSDDIQAKSEYGDERVFIPSGYGGYDDDNEANWKPVVEAIVDDGAMTGDLIDHAASGGVEEASFDKETAIRNVVDGVDDIETEEQAEAVIDYLASEEYVEDGELNTKTPVLQLDKDSVVLFDDDVKALIDNNASEKLFNTAALFAATAQAIDEYLEEADRISEQMEEMVADVEFEELYDADQELQEIKNELKTFGEGEGYPTPEEYEQMSTAKQTQIDTLKESYRMFAYIDDIDLELAENIDDFDWDRYHDSLSKCKEVYRATEASVMNVARRTKVKGDTIGEEEAVEVQRNVRQGVQSIRNDTSEAAAAQETVDQSKDSQEFLAEMSDSADETDAKFDEESTTADAEDLGMSLEQT